MNSLAGINGHNGALPTLIGQKPVRFPIGGKIRAGIKILTRAAASNEQARHIYERGVEAGRDFDAIEKAIAHVAPELRNPLTPKNVPYFSVRRCDFAMPEVADRILELYGEDRGEGGRRLYRFPVVFPADAWQMILPHALMCYGSSQLKYWSEYSPDGRNRYCMSFEKVPVDGNGRRTIRLFGGRKHVLRPENEGRCDPETCPEYQTRQCNLSGRFIFLIPGIATLSAVELATNSFYSMAAAREALETVAVLRGGRISGFLDGTTSFWITKELKEVPMIGEDGQPRRVAHWLIKLEAPVDLTRLLRADDDEGRVSQGERAVALLMGAVPVIDADAQAEAAQAHAFEPVPLAPANIDEAAGQGAAATGAPAPQAPVASRLPSQAGNPPGEETLQRLYARIEALQIPRGTFERYARKKYGAGWNVNPNGIRRVLAAVEAGGNDPQGLLAQIEAGLHALA